MSVLAFFQCMHPISQATALGLVAAAAVHYGIRKALGYRALRVLLAYGSALLLSLWLGSYAVSPLGFSIGRIPVLRGFLVTQAHGVRIAITSGQAVSLSPDSIVEIQPDRLPGPVSCQWASATRGAFDDPASCDVAYTPSPSAQYDTLKIAIRSACGLPITLGRINVGILP